GEGRNAFDCHEVGAETTAIGAHRGATGNAAAHHDVNPGAQIHQVYEVPAIQRQCQDRGVAESSAQSRVSGIDRWDFTRNGDRLALLSWLQGQIDPYVLPHLNEHAGALGGLETF